MTPKFKTLKDFAYINAHDTAYPADVDKNGWANTDAECEQLREEAIKRVQHYLILLNTTCRGATCSLQKLKQKVHERDKFHVHTMSAVYATKIELLIELFDLTEDELK